MGLDMYLSARQYLWTYKDEDQEKAEKIKKLMGSDLNVKEITMEAMYWRKANVYFRSKSFTKC